MTDKTQLTAHAEITAPISADLRRIEQHGHPASDRDTHFFLASWSGARRGDDSHTAFRSAKRYAPALPALQAAPPAPAAVAVPADLAKRIKDCAAHWAYMERIDHRDQAAVERKRHTDLVDQLAAAPAQAVAVAELDMDRVLSIADVHAEESREDGTRLLDHGGLVAFAKDVLRVAAPAQEHATQLAGQGQWKEQGYASEAEYAADMQAVGEALIETIASNHASLQAAGRERPMDSPAEIVVDLLNLLDEAKAAAPAQAQEDATQLAGQEPPTNGAPK